MSENSSGGLLNPFVLFFLLIIAVVKLVEYLWLAITIWSSVFVQVHESMHRMMADILSVRYQDRGVQDDKEAYVLEFEPRTPRQVFLINLAPLLLAPFAFALFYIGWNTDWYFAIPAFLLALGLGMQSLPSFADAWAIVCTLSIRQPVSSVAGSVVATPFALVQSPSVLKGVSWLFVCQFSFACLLAYSSFVFDFSVLSTIAGGVL
jgi:hypothetical protein